ncbi:MAG: FtsQ-type POTRA domain-containing protein [Candidatus Acidiferrales bacterium]
MDADPYPQEILGDEEPKYLRRQKPLEIKRRKFGRKAWKTYLRAALWTAVALSGAWVTVQVGRSLLFSPRMALLHPEQVSLAGNHFVPRDDVLEIFAADRGKSVLRIPLDERRLQIEAIPWVERATVRRALPNRIDVEISERTPVAFLREPDDMALVDAHGVILDRPLQGDFHFPVVTGIGPDMPLDQRAERMQLFAGFLAQVNSAQPGSMDRVSEVDLSDEHDLRATITGLPAVAGLQAAAPDSASANTATTPASSSDAAAQTPDQAPGQTDAPVLVHFGDSDFRAKFETLIQNIGQWRAAAGRVESVDLRFSREAVVNTDRTAGLQQVAQGPVRQLPARARKPAARHSN